MLLVRILAFLTPLLFACGQDGDDGRSNPKPPPEEQPEEPEEDLGLTTSIGMDPLGYQFPFLTTCMKRAGAEVLHKVPASHVDGEINEWESLEPVGSDPIGDSGDDTFDLSSFWIGKNENNLIGAVLRKGSDVPLYLEFGGTQIKNNRRETLVRRLFRISGTSLSVQEGNDWVSVNGSLKQTEDVVEFAFGMPALADVLAWPAWWVRVYGQTSHGYDSTSAIYYTSDLNGDVQQFEQSRCEKWTTQPQPFSMIYLTEREGKAGKFPMDTAAETAFQIARLGFDAAIDTLGPVTLPIESLSVIATIGRTDIPIEYEPTWHRRDLYDALAIDVSEVGPNRTESYTQGRIFREATSHFLTLYLDSKQPDAPWYLLRAVRKALVIAATRKYINDAYFLDYSGQELDVFLTAVTEDQLLPLNKLKSNAPLAKSKADAVGYLLYSVATPEQLHKAWNLVPADSENFVGSFLEILDVEVTANLTPFNRLESGWIVDGEFDQLYGLDLLQDTDHDGLPGFLEKQQGTDLAKSDTDADGWTDFAEFMSGTNPLVLSERPDIVIPDGNFNDWLILFPKKISVDAGSTGSCPSGADITHYGSLATRDHLIIGGFASSFDAEEDPVRWEAFLDIDGGKKILKLVAEKHNRHIDIYDFKSEKLVRRIFRAMPMGLNAVEWVIDRDELGIKKHFDEEGALKVKLTTVHIDSDENKQFCDQSAWFAPQVYRPLKN